ncbi:MAG TPA: hypothetical protein VFC03_03780 [Acidimicrobiales bacterium]|nr:hypothetical protein [Acidimicrobiales bacterium]
MTLTLGATHVVSVPTVFTIDTPIGLSVHLANIPNYVPRDVGSPVERHGLGRLNLGNSLGYSQHIPLVTSPQLIYPLQPEYTLCSVNMVQGATVTVDEIASSSSWPMKAMPWDRNPTAWQQQGVQTFAGSVADTLGWSYTVPAGRKLMLTHLECRTLRSALATTLNTTYSYANINGSMVLNAIEQVNTLGTVVVDAMQSSPQYILPGGLITWRYLSLDVGGTHNVYGFAAGFIFDA